MHFTQITLNMNHTVYNNNVHAKVSSVSWFERI